jgi:hypothetical protein
MRYWENKVITPRERSVIIDYAKAIVCFRIISAAEWLWNIDKIIGN